MTTDKFQPGYTFVKYGFTHHVDRRHGRIALLRKTKHAWTGYEVVIPQNLPPATLPDGTAHPGGMAMPANEDWGTNGWSYTTEQDALIRFNALTADLKKGRMPFSSIKGKARSHPNPPGGVK